MQQCSFAWSVKIVEPASQGNQRFSELALCDPGHQRKNGRMAGAVTRCLKARGKTQGLAAVPVSVLWRSNADTISARWVRSSRSESSAVENKLNALGTKRSTCLA